MVSYLAYLTHSHLVIPVPGSLLPTSCLLPATSYFTTAFMHFMHYFCPS